MLVLSNMWPATMDGYGFGVEILLLLTLVNGAANEVNHTVRNNLTARHKWHAKEASSLKLARLKKEGRTVGPLRETKEGCPPRLAEFLV